ncbi:META domain-containing protein [Xanthomonadaceae bacterium JHOS43]|nr:META domain-containing protein [Xanthomonadaceae bacterium JHOS43]MCX7563303.1 META domain-containing protein [Xanthomonadaceae bacterium XH05]
MKLVRLICSTGLTMALVACAGTNPSEEAPRQVASPETMETLEGTSWQLADASAGVLAELEASRQVTIAFAAGRASGRGGCNRYSSAYRLDQGRMMFEPVAATKMACIGDADVVERAFFGLLEKPVEASMSGDALVLRAKDGVVLRFVPYKTTVSEQ